MTCITLKWNSWAIMSMFHPIPWWERSPCSSLISLKLSNEKSKCCSKSKFWGSSEQFLNLYSTLVMINAYFMSFTLPKNLTTCLNEIQASFSFRFKSSFSSELVSNIILRMSYPLKVWLLPLWLVTNEETFQTDNVSSYLVWHEQMADEFIFRSTRLCRKMFFSLGCKVRVAGCTWEGNVWKRVQWTKR